MKEVREEGARRGRKELGMEEGKESFPIISLLLLGIVFYHIFYLQFIFTPSLFSFTPITLPVTFFTSYMLFLHDYIILPH